MYAISHASWEHVEITKLSHSLYQVGVLAEELLEKRLTKAGNYETLTTPVFWRHKYFTITFTLVVDDFGVEFLVKNTLIAQ